MQNPAVNLLKPKQEVKTRGKMRDKTHFFVLGTILALIFLVAILGFSSRQYLEDFSNQNNLARLLPRDTKILVQLNIDRENNNTRQFFEFYDRFAEKRGLPASAAKIQSILGTFSSKLDDALLREGKMLAWVQFADNGAEHQLLVLEIKNRAIIPNVLREKFLSADVPYQGVSLGRVTSEEGNFYYMFLDRYLFFSQSEQDLKTIADLKAVPSNALENNANFQKAQAHFRSPSPLFIYLNLGGAFPSGAGLAKVNGNSLELEAYYPPQGKIVSNEPEASWLRFIPSDPLLVARFPAGDARFVLGDTPFQNFFWSFLDSDGLIRKNLEATNKMAELKSLALGDLEFIVDRKIDKTLTTALIVSKSAEDETALPRLAAILKSLAVANQPQEEEVILPDGSAITEYVLPDEALPEQKEVAGIQTDIIALNPKRSLFYGYLADRLIISDSEEVFQKVIFSFREPQGDYLQKSFSGADEWFYLDLEKLASLGLNPPLAGFKNLQSVSRWERDGILIHFYLGI